MEKKEFYRHYLPHFQQPGQAYFVTWCLKDAVPPKSLRTYTQQLEMLKSQIGSRDLQSQISISGAADPEIGKLKEEYDVVSRKYRKAYDDLLDAERNPVINLSKSENRQIIMEALKYWEGRKLNNCAFTIMCNHVHWVFALFENDEAGKPVYLQDILQSVKRFSANRINKIENRQGSLWQKESFDTTIRNDRHLYYAIKYTLNNPVVAGLVSDWKLWPGTWAGSDFG